ncbi:MAG: hypothetical protein AAF738_05440 [Bacteroidota bacterium]
MKKDIPVYKVTDLAIAVVPRAEDDIKDALLWDTFIINMRDSPIRSVLISSKGYGNNVEGRTVKTNTLRHFFEEIGPKRAVQIEPIQTKLFNITNEYWVSFTFDEDMYDKKYVFVRGSIEPYNFTNIPYVERPGVMIK